VLKPFSGTNGSIHCLLPREPDRKSANLTSIFYLTIYPNPNIIRLRPTRLDEIPPETRVPRASSNINRHADTH
jgi:hypothetical protein